MESGYTISLTQKPPFGGSYGFGERGALGGDDRILKQILVQDSLHSNPLHRQPDTLLSSCACNGAACQKTNVELSAKMGPHRALPADPIGTMWIGDPSTSVGYTMMERAVGLTLKKGS